MPYTIFIICICIFLPGCLFSSNSQDSNTLIVERIQQLENNAISPSQQIAFNEELINLHMLIDDYPGYSQRLITLARIYASEGEIDAAKKSLKQAKALLPLIENSNIHYHYYLAAGVIHHNKQSLLQAKSFAHNNMQQAILAVYLGNLEEAYHLAKGQKQSDDFNKSDYAFILLTYGKAQQSIELLEEALALYKADEDINGIATTLFALGDTINRTDKQQARLYRIRANNVINSLQIESNQGAQ